MVYKRERGKKFVFDWSGEHGCGDKADESAIYLLDLTNALYV